MIWSYWGYNIALEQIVFISPVEKGFWSSYFLVGFNGGAGLIIKRHRIQIHIIHDELLTAWKCSKI